MKQTSQRRLIYLIGLALVSIFIVLLYFDAAEASKYACTVIDMQITRSNDVAVAMLYVIGEESLEHDFTLTTFINDVIFEQPVELNKYNVIKFDIGNNTRQLYYGVVRGQDDMRTTRCSASTHD